MLKTIKLKPVLLKPKEEFLKPNNINLQTQIGTTANIYSHIDSESKKASAMAIETALG